jgi:hypothetical protein
MHFDQNLIFIIVAAVIGISRLVARIAEKQHSQKRDMESQQSKPARPAREATPPKTDEQRVRDFLEALGQPAGTAPPPKVQPRRDFPPRPVAPISPPPAMPPFSPVPVRPLAEKARRIFAPKSVPTGPIAPANPDEPGAWLQEEKETETPHAAPAAPTAAPIPEVVESTWKNALRSRDSVRNAFVLREVLGPPRALSGPELA